MNNGGLKDAHVNLACEYSRLSFASRNEEVFRSSLRDANERRLYSQANVN